MKKIFLSNKSAIAKVPIIIIVIILLVVIIGAVAINWNSEPTPALLDGSTPAPEPSETTPTPEPTETTPEPSETTTEPEPTTPEPTQPEPTEPTPTEPEPTTPEPTTPEPEPVEVDLSEAVTRNLVQALVSGDGLEYVDVTLRSTSDQPLEVTVPAGTIFEAQSTGLQDMVVIELIVFDLESRDTVLSRSVSVACASMELDAPGEDDALVMSSIPAQGDLAALLGLSSFGDETFRVQQFAIWTITDNPSRDGYVGLGYFGLGSGPSDEEILTIRVLFEAAGISTEKYQALG